MSYRPTRRDMIALGAAVAAGGAATAAYTATPSIPVDPRAPIAPDDKPASFASETRHLGYSEADLAKPYAAFFRADPLPVQPQVDQALLAGPQPAEFGLDVHDLARALSKPGYLPMENGYATLPNGRVSVAVHTPMPRVTGEMWDWWFGWHSKESARYKLWHPKAHSYAGLAYDRADDPSLSDRQKYVGNASYVDEWIGDDFARIAIRFVDPKILGFTESASGETVICGRGGSSEVAVLVAWFVHQIRQTPQGGEMRSRFVFNDFGFPAEAPFPLRLMLRIPGMLSRARMGHEAARALLHHCGTEMNHLASFLPELHAAFGSRRS